MSLAGRNYRSAACRAGVAGSEQHPGEEPLADRHSKSHIDRRVQGSLGGRKGEARAEKSWHYEALRRSAKPIARRLRSVGRTVTHKIRASPPSFSRAGQTARDDSPQSGDDGDGVATRLVGDTVSGKTLRGSVSRLVESLELTLW